MDDRDAPSLLTAEDLLAGQAMTFDVVVPPQVLRPGRAAGEAATVRLRPLTLGAFLLITKAAREDSSLIPLLMIQESLVEPKLSLPQIRVMHLGLVELLIAQIRRISGLTEKKSP